VYGGRVPTVTYLQIWNKHPYPDTPCDTELFPNQCAIRMGVALREAGVSLASFKGVKCWASHSPKHILRAQQLADWMATQTTTFGKVQKFKKSVTSSDFSGKTGLVFIQDGWGPTDHIDVWNGAELKGGSPSYFARGKQVWFWEL
jgi:hypothetical protein